MRKLISTLFVSFLAFSGLQAQMALEVWGYVTDSNQTAMANVDVHINAYGSGAVFHSNVVQTNGNGYYVDSFGVAPSQGTLDVYIVDCHGDTIMERRFWSPNSAIFHIDFTGCAGNPSGGNCAAAFQYVKNGYVVNFLDFSTGSNLNYNWDFGDGHTSTQHQPVHTYNAQGAFQVCLTVSNVFCSSTFCDSVVIDSSGTSAGCHAAFTYGIQQGVVYFQNQSSGTSSYLWDFGDGQSSTAVNPNHSYTNAGTYTVCLVASTPGTTCADTVCHTIQVGSGNTFYNIGGFVTAGGLLADYCTVYLIQVDSTPVLGTTLTAIDTLQMAMPDSGYYYFTHVLPGRYLVKAALDSNSMYYANYMPTYYDTVLYWNIATSVVVGPNVFHADIHLVPGNNPGGPGFIGGLVSQGANKTNGPGDPIEGASVLLLTDQDEPVTHTVTDNAGKFGFDNLAYGSYKVRVEVLGKTSEIFYATIDASNEEVDNANFKVNKTDVTVGIWNRPIENELNVTVYPNPASTIMSIALGGEVNENLDFRMVDISGRTVMLEPALLGPNQNQVSISLDQIPTGTYLIELYQNDVPVYRSKLVRFK